MSRFQNKKVFITGGNSGMGFETAKLFIREGAKVVITGRSQDSLKAAQSELGPNLLAIQADISDLKDHARIVTEAKNFLGHIDTLFLNAGIAKFSSFAETDVQNFDQTFSINVKGPYFLTQALLPLLKEGSSVLFNASVAAHSSLVGASVYSASKAALKSIARVLTDELADKKIRVNVISPGPIETPIFGRSGLSGAEIEGFKNSMATSNPSKRLGTPQEIASLVAFVSSSEAGFINGSEFIIEGGTLKL